MIADLPADDNELKNTIQSNVCGRNKDLSSLIRIIVNLLDEKRIVALDGDWGSGKTFLIKQLELMWRDETIHMKGGTISEEDLLSFRSNIIPFYFNAWENDHISSPSQALFGALVQSLSENKNIIERSERKLVNSIKFAEFIKNASAGLLDFSDSDSQNGNNGIFSPANGESKLRESISKTISDKIGFSNSCNLLFIIDDLDRCNPAFAVRLIEYIKNGFNNNRLLFLIATNYKELGNIIRGHYGGYINGHQYLDRIFDLRIGVSDYNRDDYIRYKVKDDLAAWSTHNIADGLKLSMRELNRYISVISLYHSYLTCDYFLNDSTFYDICRYFFVPLFVGYKIRDYQKYTELSSGGDNGLKIILQYLTNNREMRSYIIGMLKIIPTNDLALETLTREYYNKLFSRDRDSMQIANSFWDMINITSSSLDLS